MASGPVLGAARGPSVTEVSLPVTVQSDLSPLPQGYPIELNNKLAWIGADFKNESDYVYHLSEAEIQEIVDAIADFKSRGLGGECVSREYFPLPNLGVKLDQASREIHEGRGFFVLRGLKPAMLSVEDLNLAYLGVQSYIADERGRQDAKGNMLVHIIAENGSKQRMEHHRYSNKTITFHNEEAGDVIGWLTRGAATTGGKCIVASAYTVYNALAASRPDIVRLLARSDWPFALPSFHCRPILFHHDSKIIMNFGRAPLVGNAAHPRPKNLPACSSRQLEALDAIDAIARATELEIQTQAGDMHFINNLAIFHRRDSFTNSVNATQKRHLVRMRLRSSLRGWAIPEELRQEWYGAFEKAGRQVWHLEPMPETFFPLRRNPN